MQMSHVPADWVHVWQLAKQAAQVLDPSMKL
jgi:hypothetical protein